MVLMLNILAIAENSFKFEIHLPNIAVSNANNVIKQVALIKMLMLLMLLMLLSITVALENSLINRSVTAVSNANN